MELNQSQFFFHHSGHGHTTLHKLVIDVRKGKEE